MTVRVRRFCLLLTVVVLLSLLPLPCYAESGGLSISAQSAILIDAEHGCVLYAKNADARLPMASTTKIITALVALENSSPDTLVSVAPEAIGVEGSSVYLTAGERLTMEQLLYALLLESANDAAVAIAVAVAGSVEDFAVMMNRKAEELGLRDSAFRNPHGLDADGHYTTARELAIITQCAMKNEHFSRIVSTGKTTIPHAGTEGVRLLINHNKLLRFYDGCIGVKTGYTKKSGRCLVSAAERDGVRLIAVTLNAPDDWNDHRAMLDLGFSLTARVTLCEANEFCLPVPVVGGTSASVIASNPEALQISLPQRHPVITHTVEMQRFFFAPLASGEQVGTVIFFCDLNEDGYKEMIGSAPLIVQCGIERQPPKKRSFWEWLRSLFCRS